MKTEVGIKLPGIILMASRHQRSAGARKGSSLDFGDTNTLLCSDFRSLNSQSMRR